MHADQQRADPAAAAALAPFPAADDHFLAADVLDLPPRRGPDARLVARVQPLGHHALEPVLAGRGEHVGPPVPGEGRRHLPPRPGQPQTRQYRTPLRIRGLQQQPAVQDQHVEGEVGDRQLGGQPRRPAGLGDVHPLLEQLEAGPPGGVEGDDLPVQHRLGPARHGIQPVQFRVGAGHLPAQPGDQPDLAVADVGQGPDAVPFHFIRPAVVAGGQRARGGQHRPQPGRQFPPAGAHTAGIPTAGGRRCVVPGSRNMFQCWGDGGQGRRRAPGAGHHPPGGRAGRGLDRDGVPGGERSRGRVRPRPARRCSG